MKITNFDDRIDILSIDWSQDGATLALSRGKTFRGVVLLCRIRALNAIHEYVGHLTFAVANNGI